MNEFIAPVVSGNVILTSAFRTASRPSHHGIDLAPRPRGNPAVLAYDDGEIILMQLNNPGAGNWLEIFHGSGHSKGKVTTYMHLADDFPLLEKGSKVKKGERIGTMGTTGQSTGVHLHFELRNVLPRNGGKSAIDPLPLLMGEGSGNGGGNWPISEDTIQALVQLGVTNSPEYWRGVVNVKYLDVLLKNMLRLIPVV